MLHGIIMAGGMGKRLWPKSRKKFPKYLLKINSGKSLLEDTMDLLAGIIPKENICIITGAEHLLPIRVNIPACRKQRIITEPVSRNTAPSILLSAGLAASKDPEAVCVVMPADHLISDKNILREALSFALFIAGIDDSIVTIGIRPRFPSTGYGYIRCGKLYKSLEAEYKFKAYAVDEFIEKPLLIKAKSFLRSKSYLWNAGIFVAKAKVLINEFKVHQPKMYKNLRKMEKGFNSGSQQRIINKYYSTFENESFDYAIMERTERTYVVKTSFEWNDIGSWKSVEDYIKKDRNGNIVQGDVVVKDVEDSVFIGENGHLIAAVGLKDVVVVRTDDATLVCSKDRAQEVKELVGIIEKNGLEKYL